MRRLRYIGAMMSVAAVIFASNGGSAQTSDLLDQLEGHTNLEFFMCTTVLHTAEAIADTPGYGPNSRKAKEAYKEFHKERDEAARNGEARFSVLKKELASKESAAAALKELYVYWRAELAPCTAGEKSEDAITRKFKLLLERLRVEASW